MAKYKSIKHIRYCCILKNVSIANFNDIYFTHRYKRQIFNDLKTANEFVEFHKKLGTDYKICKLTITLECLK